MARAQFVDQTILYKPGGSEKGNCTEAAVASILGLTLDQVPDFRAKGVENFWDEFEDFINSRGFHPLRLDGNWIPDVLYLASGLSPRGVHHMVLMRGGKLVHDPHPSKAGISETNHIWVLVPFDPAGAYANG